ncbi:MAG TPA: late competence development ComFB family protein [Clostridiales bacterium]|nr:late competence development ComFB family protein [Clostridiales bacterium]
MGEKTSAENLLPVNIMEEFVREKVREAIRNFGSCDCDVCFLNACAIALNALEPKYVTTTKGALLSQITEMELGNQTNILVECTKAVMKVMKNPHHN